MGVFRGVTGSVEFWAAKDLGVKCKARARAGSRGFRGTNELFGSELGCGFSGLAEEISVTAITTVTSFQVDS